MNSKTVSMAAIGFSEQETRVLKTVCSLSRSGRPCHYHFSDQIPDSDLLVFICNADNPDAVARWHVYRVAFPDAVVVMATRRHGLSDGPYLTLRRPLSARQILDALDSIFIPAEVEAPIMAHQSSLQQTLRRTVEGFMGSFQSPGMQTA